MASYWKPFFAACCREISDRNARHTHTHNTHWSYALHTCRKLKGLIRSPILCVYIFFRSRAVRTYWFRMHVLISYNVKCIPRQHYQISNLLFVPPFPAIFHFDLVWEIFVCSRHSLSLPFFCYARIIFFPLSLSLSLSLSPFLSLAVLLSMGRETLTLWVFPTSLSVI